MVAAIDTTEPRLFSRLLRIARERRKISQAVFAVQCGVSQSAVAQWESGHRPLLESTVANVAAALGLTVEEFVRGELAALRRQEGKERS